MKCLAVDSCNITKLPQNPAFILKGHISRNVLYEKMIPYFFANGGENYLNVLLSS